jgi:hypothetical protein
MSQYCTQCAVPNDDAAKFCRGCGQTLTGSGRLGSDYAPYESSLGQVRQAPEVIPPPALTPQRPVPAFASPNPVQAYRQQVNPGVCVLVSFLWTGAGLFFVPDRVALGIILACGVQLVFFVLHFFGAIIWGIGLLCTIPLHIIVHFSVMFITYQSAVRYNAAA